MNRLRRKVKKKSFTKIDKIKEEMEEGRDKFMAHTVFPHKIRSQKRNLVNISTNMSGWRKA